MLRLLVLVMELKLASEGLAELVKSFNGITNAGYALGAVVAVMGGFVGMLGLS